MNSEILVPLLGLPALPHYIKTVERTLESAMDIDNPYLHEPALRLIKSGGKRLRPILTMAAASCQGGNITNAVTNAAAAIELIHIGTIVHDDIIDDADVRWNVPTVNNHEGVSRAILVGDFLLAKAVAIASSVSREAGQLAAETIAIMCDGQCLETADDFNLKRSIESYNDTIYKKTAALISTACRIGAQCAGLPVTYLDALADYGASYGMAYQLIDDLLDVTASAETMGKPTMHDINEGVYTFPVLTALQSSKQNELARLLKAAGKQTTQSKIVRLLSDSGAFYATISEIKKHIAAAENSLIDFPKSKSVEGLIKFPNAYFQWAMQKQSVIKF